MKKIIFSMMFLSFLCYYSCQNDTISEEIDSFESDGSNSSELSNQEISNLLNHYFQRLQKNEPTTRSMGIPVIKTLKKDRHTNALITKAGDSEQQEFTICNVDFQGDGFAIVLADKRLPLVLAYSPRGNYSQIKDSENPMLTKYVEDIPSSVGNILSQIHYLYPTYPNADNKYNNFPYPRISDDIYQWTDDKGCFNDVAYLEETTLWGQDDPYNKYLPFKSDSTDKQLVGCVAIALTNVMSYFKYPETYNWKIMTAVQNVKYNDFAPRGAADTIALFLKEVTTILNTQFKDSVSIATPNDCMRALAHYNYSYHKTQPYHIDSVGKSVKEKKPVITFGQSKYGNTGHAFVIRGYWEIKVTPEMREKGGPNNYLYGDGISLGVTWGNSGGWGDGWYLVQWDDLNISDLGLGRYDPSKNVYVNDYSVNLSVITNIKPQK